MSSPPTPVLMSGANPDGWKLEELLPQIAREIRAKNDRLEDDASPTSQAIVRNNLGVIDCLALAEVRQRDTLRRLDALAPDAGPTGTPRIGIGSVGMTAAAASGGDPALSAPAPLIPTAPIANGLPIVPT